MSRKDYVAVARAIAATRYWAYVTDSRGCDGGEAPEAEDVLDFLADQIAAAFAADSDRFDRERFIAATHEEVRS